MPTKNEIDQARTPAGGWTREQLARWGVPWPPPKGWKQRLIYESQRPSVGTLYCGKCGRPEHLGKLCGDSGKV